MNRQHVMRMAQLSGAPFLALLLSFALTACGGGGSNALPVTATTGTLSIKVTDAPVDDAAEVVIVFTGIELQRSSGEPLTINFDTPKSIDLLKFRDGLTANLVEGLSVSAGQYSWLRLLLSAQQNLQSGSYIKLKDGRQFPLFIPSGTESGLKLVRPFVVAQGGLTRLVIDFDLRKSVVAPPGQAPNWFLRPALRLIDELQVGTLSGSIDLAALAAAQQRSEAACRPGVYVYTGADATPDDMDGNAADGPDPLVYGPVSLPTQSGTAATYTIRFVEPGAYTVAATCYFDIDTDPATSEFTPVSTGGAPTMVFTRKNATVTASATTRIDFP